MARTRVRFALWQIMATVAAFALFFAVVRAVGTIAILIFAWPVISASLALFILWRMQKSHWMGNDRNYKIILFWILFFVFLVVINCGFPPF